MYVLEIYETSKFLYNLNNKYLLRLIWTLHILIFKISWAPVFVPWAGPQCIIDEFSLYTRQIGTVRPHYRKGHEEISWCEPTDACDLYDMVMWSGTTYPFSCFRSIVLQGILLSCDGRHSFWMDNGGQMETTWENIITSKKIYSGIYKLIQFVKLNILNL